MKNFADRLLEKIEERDNPSVIGLDSDFTKIPDHLKIKNLKKFGNNVRGVTECILEFNKKLLDSISDIVPAVKIQSAFYEMYGFEGMRVFQETADYAKRKNLIVIGDVKRNDIGNTAKAYSSGYIGEVDVFGRKGKTFDLDCITVNPYLGSDGIAPFIEDSKNNGKGIFVLVKTSNPSSIEIQDLETANGKIYETVARLVSNWSEGLEGERGYSPVGAVVGATFPEEMRMLRKIMERSILLVPGYGTQGGGIKDVKNAFNQNGSGALIHSARKVIFSFEKNRPEDFDLTAREECVRMRDEINMAVRI
ncbi:MAG: orotidine-5'-phosphate decarboxylase [Candidatus Aenigmarchaeota archaeon]|nr:orotidine-5'-phosphate decarboxylase [Candidatus Aenigmarchaeota archaeon]